MSCKKKLIYLLTVKKKKVLLSSQKLYVCVCVCLSSENIPWPCERNHARNSVKVTMEGSIVSEKGEKSSTLPIKEEALVTSWVFDFFCFCSCCKMWTSTDVHCIYHFVLGFFMVTVKYVLTWRKMLLYFLVQCHLLSSSVVIEPHSFFLFLNIYIYSVYLYIWVWIYI